MGNRGLIIGRFQPFHNGHLELVHQALRECKELIIVIGSAQFNYILQDPFTAGERIQMIHEVFLYEKIDMSRIYIIPLNNFENNACWLAYLISMVPKFDAIYSGNNFIASLVHSNINIKKPRFKNKNKCNGKNIRDCIARNVRWQNLVPISVKNIIEQIDGVQRIKMLVKSDTLPQRW